MGKYDYLDRHDRLNSLGKVLQSSRQFRGNTTKTIGRFGRSVL